VILTLFALIAAISHASELLPSVTECNGSNAICSRKYSKVSLIGTYGSAHVGSNYDWHVNQERSLAFQLDDGIRFLQARIR
jgi:hypothetical protein